MKYSDKQITISIETLHKAFNRIISMQVLQVRIERYERNFLWQKLLNELKSFITESK